MFNHLEEILEDRTIFAGGLVAMSMAGATLRFPRRARSKSS